MHDTLHEGRNRTQFQTSPVAGPLIDNKQKNPYNIGFIIASAPFSGPDSRYCFFRSGTSPFRVPGGIGVGSLFLGE